MRDMRLSTLEHPDRLAGLQPAAACPLVDADELKHHLPDRHLLVEDDAGRIVARCSLWYRPQVRYDGDVPGFIGHYGAADGESAVMLLQGACDDLRHHGCSLAIGPLDGTTWRRYRFIIERGPDPPFFLEPDNPDSWPGHFRKAGFSHLAGYISSLNSDLVCHDPRQEELDRRMAELGVTVRPVNLAGFSGELESIYRLSLVSFAGNFLYSPISRNEFIAMYEKVRPLIRPELALVAEHEGSTVGFVFAIPDFCQQQRGEQLDRVVAKTIAILPDRRYRGLGRLLLNQVLKTAHDLGFRQAIHALMHESNRSVRMGLGDVRVIRRYALFGRRLG